MIRSKQGVLNSIVRQEISSSFSYRVISLDEAQSLTLALSEMICNAGSSDINKVVASLLIVSLITGLSIEETLSIKGLECENTEKLGLFWKRVEQGWLLLDLSDIPCRDTTFKPAIAVSTDALIAAKTEAAIFPMPRVVALELLPEIQNQNSEAICQHAKHILKRIGPSMRRQVSLKKIQSFASHYMRQNSERYGDYLMLPSAKIEQNVGCYYFQTDRRAIWNSYTNMLKDIGLSLLPMSYKNARVGTALVAKEKEVSSAFSQMFDHLQSAEFHTLEGFWKYHNWLATYVGNMLRLASASRCELATVVTRFSLDLQRRLWRFREKGKVRTIPVPALVVEQLHAYISYLDFIRDLARGSDPFLSQTLKEILRPDSKKPLVFANDAPQIFPGIFETKLIQHMSLKLKKNSYRHFCYTHLSETLTEEFLLEYVGHTRFFNDVRCEFSGQNDLHIETIRNATSHLFKALGIKSFNPLARYQ